jgi:hypothetical protein
MERIDLETVLIAYLDMDDIVIMVESDRRVIVVQNIILIFDLDFQRASTRI